VQNFVPPGRPGDARTAATAGTPRSGQPDAGGQLNHLGFSHAPCGGGVRFSTESTKAIHQMMKRSVIRSTGQVRAGSSCSNDDLAGILDTSDEWIRQRTGIEARTGSGKALTWARQTWHWKRRRSRWSEPAGNPPISI